MIAEILLTLAKATLLSTIAILCVTLLRIPLRQIAGARVAYWLWLLVPATTLTLLLPAPSQLLLPGEMSAAVSLSAIVPGTISEPTPLNGMLMRIALSVWVAGMTVLLIALLARQRAFLRSLGSIVPHAQGIFRGENARAPMLVGLFHARIVVPADFESRYATREQDLVLAHERAHHRRRDIWVSAFALLSLCIFWFNPLMYLAVGWLRRDQELACDEHVLSNLPRPHADARRIYANALLKTQLAAETAWPVPIGCHWQSTHPLRERIVMLKKQIPGLSRRVVGTVLVLGLTSVSGYIAWAGQTIAGKGEHILVDLKVTVTVPATNEMQALATRYLVRSGEEIKGVNSQPLDYSCIPYLPDAEGRITDWSALNTRGVPLPANGQILLDCAIREAGLVVQSPAVIVGDGKPGRIESTLGGRQYRLDFTATTSADRIADATRESAIR